ncbi:histidine n-acetyltransferase [Plakobranchus ocellatus]|uniref:Histidine n-acetyltransferase n=1 Tax=Plakobranchus ocellatus TaxID=259542 RepID=A0AAV3YYU1_9GAST|nr:histidine n-acetyltransferase [Plakobranchus ocellatus]
MASIAKDVVIRRALQEDFEAVLSIGEMYGGRDYLKALYLPFIENKDTYAVVATIQDAVVGFSMTTTFDGGLTVMSRASRVHEKFRGLGIYHMMKEELEKHTRLKSKAHNLVVNCDCGKANPEYSEDV